MQLTKGADTMVWMCCFKDLEKFENGSFFQDRTPANKHLPFSWTENTLDEENALMTKLDDYYQRFANDAS